MTRIWSFNPKYLDQKGLVAVWREALLAKSVLMGATQGYKFHPQLKRFIDSPDPDSAINAYLHGVFDEAINRGYNFDKNKVARISQKMMIPVTEGQLLYEWTRFKEKLGMRDIKRLETMISIHIPETHPIFSLIPGKVESWEKVIPPQ